MSMSTMGSTMSTRNLTGTPMFPHMDACRFHRQTHHHHHRADACDGKLKERKGNTRLCGCDGIRR